MRPIFNIRRRPKVAIFDWANVTARAYAVRQEDWLGLLCRMLLRYRRRLPGWRFAFALEGSGSDKRRRLFAGYKAGRGGLDRPPDVLTDSIELLRYVTGEVVRAADGEADDAIATYVRHHAEDASRILIVSEDRDLWQLMSRRVRILTKKGEVGPEECRARLGVRPEQVLMHKALLGDSSDGLPRVPRASSKTLIRLARECPDPGELSRVLGEVDWVSDADRKRILGHRSTITCNWTVARLVSDLPLELELSRANASDLLGFLAGRGVHLIGPDEAKVIAGDIRKGQPPPPKGGGF